MSTTKEIPGVGRDEGEVRLLKDIVVHVVAIHHMMMIGVGEMTREGGGEAGQEV